MGIYATAEILSQGGRAARASSAPRPFDIIRVSTRNIEQISLHVQQKYRVSSKGINEYLVAHDMFV